MVHWLERERAALIAGWYDNPRARAAYWRRPDIVAKIQAVEAWRDDVEMLLTVEEAAVEQRYAEQCRTRQARAAEDMRRSGSFIAFKTVDEYVRYLEEEDTKARTSQIEQIAKCRADLAAWDGLRSVPLEEVGAIQKSEWERPIMHKTGNSVIGFVDYYVEFEDVPLLLVRDEDKLPKCTTGVGTHAANVVATVAIALAGELRGTEPFRRRLPSWDCRERFRHLCVEVKVHIEQVSELLRQLQFYKVYESGPWAVASPEWTHAQTLLDHGFGFILYTPGSPPVVYKPGSQFVTPIHAPVGREGERMHSAAYTTYMASDAWRAKRREALEAAGYACANCGASDDLQVHHRTYDNLGAEPLSDLEVLCAPCHEQADEERRGEVADELWQRRVSGWARKVYGADWQDRLSFSDVEPLFREQYGDGDEDDDGAS